MTDFDRVLAFATVVSTKLGTAAKQVLVSLRAFSDGDGDDDASSEGSSDEPLYGSIGVFTRPRDKDATGAAELLCARTQDGLQPISGRDLRIVQARGNVAKGSVSLAGYGGGFFAIEDTPAATSSILIAYAPYPGTPAPKAHVLQFDTTAGNESIVLAHAEGHGLILGKDKIATLKNKAGDAFVACDDNGVTISGDVKLGNNLIVGSPPGAIDGVVLSTQLLLWITQVNAALVALNTLLVTTGLPVIGGGGGTAKAGAPVTVPVAVPLASTKIKVEPP
jgi:hypothetical protein